MNLIDTVFVTGSGDSLTFGGQFKTYKMTNGIELTLKYFPLYDDITYNRVASGYFETAGIIPYDVPGSG